MKLGQAIYQGDAGTYHGCEEEVLPFHLDEKLCAIDQHLGEQELNYLGRLSCSQFAGIQVYTYATSDCRVAVSVLMTDCGLGGIDCVSKFSDGSFLTTTTSRVLQDVYDKQGLYRRSYPELDVQGLLAQHHANVQEMQMRFGAAQRVFRNLSGVAQVVDEYTVRQKRNSGHVLWKWIGGFKILLGV